MFIKKYAKKVSCFLGLAVLFALAAVHPAGAVCDPAQQACSSSYGVSETFFGNGGELNACSSSYCTKQSAGETTVGATSSTSYTAQTGFNSNRTEYLEFIVNTTSIDFGVLSSGSAKTGTATFSVKAYLASGYQVVTVSDPPKNAGSTLANLTTPTASSPGTEQFGINLVANTSPTTFGADPVQVPGAGFSYGAAASGYNTPNQYKYVKNDVVASSPKSSGETDYTISYLLNISNTTPGGTYTMAHNLVATATF